MYDLALLLFCISFSVNVMSQTVFAAKCSSTYFLCDPSGATRMTLGPIGPAWDSLYADLVTTVGVEGKSSNDSPSVNADGPVKKQDALCCAATSECLLVESYQVGMCWDQFTTNVYFQDGTYGNIVSSQFTTADGGSIDLVYGNYTLASGQKGNIYDGTENSTPPDTSRMTMPTPFTSSGIGSAIPATQLGTTGVLSVVTTVIPATTIPATTMPSITITEATSGCPFCLHNGTTIAGPTLSGGSNVAITSLYGTILPSPYTPHNRAGALVATVVAASLVFIISSLAMALL